MSNRIALIGAGGKMGCRVTDNFLKCSYDVDYVEVSERGLQNLQERGVRVVPEDRAASDADVVILAVPDVMMGEIAGRVIPRMRAGALLMTLDPAAPLDGQIPVREDIGCVVAHPCHPSVFNWEPTEAAFRDFYGGISARQAVVCALMWGNDDHYRLGVEIATAMYAPVSQVHRVSLEQMAMLEPALVETLAQTCMEAVKEGHDRLVDAGVPSPAVRDFVLGHLRIQIAVLFGEVNGTFSDAAYKISRRAKSVIFKDDWQRIFELSDIREQVRDITTP
ncbi:MAG: phosphogluconate dehydrogenase C-terminal domain-containing protein [Vicinamibacterales bacterium]